MQRLVRGKQLLQPTLTELAMQDGQRLPQRFAGIKTCIHAVVDQRPARLFEKSHARSSP